MRAARSWGGRWAACAVALGLLTHCGVGPEAPPEAASTPEGLGVQRQEAVVALTFWPTADATAAAQQPDTPLGTQGTLGVDTSPAEQSYLQFTVSGIRGRVTRATLRLYAIDGTHNGPRVFDTFTNLWTEQNLVWNNAPSPIGQALGDAGAIAAGTWVEYDVTQRISWDKTLAFLLRADSSDGVDFASREHARADRRPQLVVQVDTGEGCTPRTEGTQTYCTYRGTGGGLVSWTRRYGGQGPERLRALASDAQGGFVAVGQFGDTPFPYEQGFALARYDAQGTPVWSRTVTTAQVRPAAVALTPEGNILVVGSYGGAPDLGSGPLPAVPFPGSALFLAKFSPTGQPVWSRGFFSHNGASGSAWRVQNIEPEALATDAQGSLIVVGRLHGRVDLGGGPIDAGPGSLIDPNAEWNTPGGFVAKFTWQGTHAWSRAYTARRVLPWAYPESVSTDATGHVLVGGRASEGAHLGDGALLSKAMPFIVRYTPDGAVSRKRLFYTYGSVTGVQPLSTGDVAFSANIGGRFTFNGDDKQGGGVPPRDDPEPWNYLSGYVGTLNADGSDGWIRNVGLGRVEGVVAGGAGTFTVLAGWRTEFGGGDLGGGPLASYQSLIGHYGNMGEHLWSRAFDGNFWGGYSSDDQKLLLAPLPGGALLLGGDFFDRVWVEGTITPSRGNSDLFYLRLNP